MAITLGDLVERLEEAQSEISQCNYGHAYSQIGNVINVLKNNGVTIHATARTDNKRVEEDAST